MISGLKIWDGADFKNYNLLAFCSKSCEHKADTDEANEKRLSDDKERRKTALCYTFGRWIWSTNRSPESVEDYELGVEIGKMRKSRNGKDFAINVLCTHVLIFGAKGQLFVRMLIFCFHLEWSNLHRLLLFARDFSAAHRYLNEFWLFARNNLSS